MDRRNDRTTGSSFENNVIQKKKSFKEKNLRELCLLSKQKQNKMSFEKEEEKMKLIATPCILIKFIRN